MTLFIDISEKSLGKKDVTYRIGDSRHFGSGKVNSQGRSATPDDLSELSVFDLN